MVLKPLFKVVPREMTLRSAQRSPTHTSTRDHHGAGVSITYILALVFLPINITEYKFVNSNKIGANEDSPDESFSS